MPDAYAFNRVDHGTLRQIALERRLRPFNQTTVLYPERNRKPSGGAGLLWDAYAGVVGAVAPGDSEDITTYTERVSADDYDFGFTFGSMVGAVTFTRAGWWRVHLDAMLSFTASPAAYASGVFEPMHDAGAGYTAFASGAFESKIVYPDLLSTQFSQHGGIEFLYEFANGDKLKWRLRNPANPLDGETIELDHVHWTMMPVNQ